ncbi:DMT family transporter [Candidatus Formimonas warabiya]|uniref:EamA domain-containing protein n=1 Tax=Formimonas warabiya TaxID=1761012 RepID=A0A3G1L0J1_FORW1|nr:DMT family transporter [Candidatus Formimonas warabiya]ATW28177.1 hypothetical protein DCMF_28525 [Candidatus Formimonas warabiya]
MMKIICTSDQSRKIKYFAVTLWAVILWSTSYPVIRYLVLAGSDPFLVAFCRTFFTMIIFAGLLFWMKKPPSFAHFKANWPLLLGMSLTGVVGMFLALAIGLQYVPAGKSTLINSINPALIVFMAHFVFHEPLSWRRITGLVLSLLGVLLVITGNDLGVWHRLSFQAADLFFVFSGFCWAFYSILNRALGDRMDPMEGLFWVFACAVICLLPVAIILGNHFRLFSAQSWLWLFYLGLFPGALGNYFWYQGIIVVGAANAGLINSFLPLSAIIISYFTLGEILTPLQMAGATILTFGVWLGIYRTPKPGAFGHAHLEDRSLSK